MHFFQKTKGPVAESRETGGVLARFAAMVGSLAGGVQRRKAAALSLLVVGATTLLIPSSALAFFDTIGHALMSATAMLTGAAGLLLNYAIGALVLGMGNLLGTGGGSVIGMGPVIQEMWGVIRDVCNLAFIFGLIFIGFQTILNIETLNTKKTLVAIVVGALLINFSLFFTQVIIDVSNAIAAELHEILLIPEGTLPDGSAVEGPTNLEAEGLNYGVAGIFVQHMGLTKFFGGGETPTLTTINVTGGGAFSYFFMGTIFLLIAAFVFAAGAILLIVRFVTLTLLLMFSPILFAGMVFPQTQGFAKGLWKKLLNNAFLAPMYLFMLVITAKFLAETQKGFGGDYATAFNAGSDGIASVGAFAIVLNFVLAATLLIASLVIAKQMSATGADKSLNMLKGAGKSAGKFAMRRAGGLAFGTAAVAGRSVIGKAAYKLSESERLKDRAATGFFSKQLLKGSRGVASSSFDARGVGGVGKSLGLGEGKKGGYKAYTEGVKKKEMEFAKSLGEVEDEDDRVSALKNQVDVQRENINRLKDVPSAQQDKAQIRAEERRLAQMEEQVRREKNRRQIGSSRNNNGLRLAIKKAGEERKDLLNQLGAATDQAAVDSINTKIKELDEFVKDVTKDARAQDSGYAGYLENTSLIKSWLTGRFNSADRAAGEEIRRTYEKKVKKSKEDERTDKIVDTLKESSSKTA